MSFELKSLTPIVSCSCLLWIRTRKEKFAENKDFYLKFQFNIQINIWKFNKTITAFCVWNDW